MLLWTERRADPSSTLRSVEKTCYPQRALGGAGVGSFIRVVSSERDLREPEGASQSLPFGRDDKGERSGPG